VVIVPIMTLQQVLDWNGTGYRAVVLAGDYEHPETREYTAAADVYARIGAGFLPAGKQVSDIKATDRDINRAGDLLTAVVRGLAYSLHHPDELSLSPESRLILSELCANFATIRLAPKAVSVPKARELSDPPVRVRVVEFPDDGVPGHLAPDPLLLAVKSAINWSWRNNQKLKAAGERPQEADEIDGQGKG
jgi:hypothetical protein